MTVETLAAAECISGREPDLAGRMPTAFAYGATGDLDGNRSPDAVIATGTVILAACNT
jgi:hypothetical protein